MSTSIITITVTTTISIIIIIIISCSSSTTTITTIVIVVDPIGVDPICPQPKHTDGIGTPDPDPRSLVNWCT